MKKTLNSKKGFTIIEVVLFLAISGALLAMVIAGTSTAVARRRYSDAVNDLVEQIRNAYSATINVQNSRIKTEGSSNFCSVESAFENGSLVDNTNNHPTDNYPGRTRCAVYGQLLTFGEKGDNGRPDAMMVYRYDIIGLALEDDINPGDLDSADSTLASLKSKAKADIVTFTQDEDNKKFYVQLSGNYESYLTQWDVTIEQKGAERKPYVGAIMIVRSPVSGTVHTYSYTADEDGDGAFNNIFDVQEFIKNNSAAADNVGNLKTTRFVAKAIGDNKMKKDNVIICVGSEDLFAIPNRRAIKIQGNGSTESAVELLALDTSSKEETCGK